MPNKGFTLLELLLVMGLMATLTAVMVPNLRNFNISQRLVDGASQLQSDLRQTQNSASSGLKCTTNTATKWYLEFLRDAAGNITIYNISATCLNGEVHPVLSKSLPSGVKIGQVDLDSCVVTNSAELHKFRINYSNITGQVGFDTNVTSCGSSPRPQQVKLYLKSDSDPNLINKVILNTGGAIYAQ